MIRRRGVVLALSALALATQPACASAVNASAATMATDTVHVAPPTGTRDVDRASILAALEQVQPGGTVQFEPGTYLVGEIVPIPTTRVTLLGHRDGTTLRGCDPAAYEAMERDAAAAGDDWRARFDAVRRCGIFELMGGHATVRGFTFEYSRMGLMLGCCHAEREQRLTEGGYLIEGNTFRNSGNGIRPGMLSSEPTVIRRNRFVNTFHAISAMGGHLHVLDNDISVPEPERVPGVGHPSFAISFCGDHNLVAGNRIEGHPDGIELYAWGEGCRHNVIRDNTIAVSRVPLPGSRPYADLVRITDFADSTIVGVPLLLTNATGEPPLEENLIEGNRFLGAEGIAIELSGGASNRIVNNTFSAIRVRDPFPGNMLGAPPVWEIANGSAIWVSAGSVLNEIRGNAFEDIEAYAVVLEGDGNVVETHNPSDAVHDLGSGNRIISRAMPTRTAHTVETGRLIFHQLLHPVGEETYTLTPEGDGWLLLSHFRHNDRGQTAERRVELHLGPDLAARAWHLREIEGSDTTTTGVEVRGRSATLTDASGARQVVLPDRFFTSSAHSSHAVQGMLVRYWLRNGRPDSIAIQPQGQATVAYLGRDTLVTGGVTIVLERYHVRGVRWGGQTLWLDADERLIAALSFDFGYQAVREGYEHELAFFSERARYDLLARAEEASHRLAPLHTGTFALVGGTVIDGTSAPPLRDATVLVREGRITAVGPRATVELPADAAVVDVSGRSVLPGLWDMHAHLAGITDFGPIYLAAGVTSVRDLGNETAWGLALRDAFATGRIAGPRLLLAVEIDGRVPEAVGAIQADTPEEARALVRQYHDLGFEQIKLYNRLMPELVPVIAEEAHRLGMTVTGHVPWGMSLIDAVRAGVDQINHLDAVMQPMLPDSLVATGDFPRITAAFLSLDAESAELRHLIDTLLQHGTVLDLTLAAFENWWRPASVPLRDIEPGAVLMPPELAAMKQGGGVAAGEAADRAAIFRKALEIVGMMHRAGVPIVAGTDVVVPGHSLHRELELYVAAGMTPLDAIRSATAVPARAMGLGHEVGTIEVGKRADLIVVDGDPLRDIQKIRNVRAVIVNGRMFDTAALWRSVGFGTGTSR